MNRSLLVGAAVAASVGFAGLAQAQIRTSTLTPVPPATEFHGSDLMINGSADPALHYLGNGILVYDLRGNKMVNCEAAGVPAAGSVGSPAPFHPCR